MCYFYVNVQFATVSSQHGNDEQLNLSAPLLSNDAEINNNILTARMSEYKNDGGCVIKKKRQIKDINSVKSLCMILLLALLWTSFACDIFNILIQILKKLIVRQ